MKSQTNENILLFMKNQLCVVILWYQRQIKLFCLTFIVASITILIVKNKDEISLNRRSITCKCVHSSEQPKIAPAALFLVVSLLFITLWVNQYVEHFGGSGFIL